MSQEGYWTLQGWIAAAMLIVTCIAGCAPLALLQILAKKGKEPTKSGWLSYLSCFSGGVFMATCFLDIIPNIGEKYTELLLKYQLTFAIPLNQVFICCGFFFVYFIEEAIGRVFGHSHGTPTDPERVRKEDLRRRSEDGIPAVPAPLDSQLIRQQSLDQEDQKASLLKSITFAVAMSLHSLLEGFALGVQDTTTAIYSLFFSLLLHKSIEAFSVGLQISKANTDKYKTVMLTVSIYSLMTPIGVLLGCLLESSGSETLTKDALILFVECLAGGAFIYITFLENCDASMLQIFLRYEPIYTGNWWNRTANCVARDHVILAFSEKRTSSSSVR
ncbi:unnamed protein product [Caenorhabditis sp. 36 PRJEB53466]|nr:unnamed protein product [Caenorhabditis sp. 36 PRJEB53466]